MTIGLMLSLAAFASGPIVLDNGAIRVEVEPCLFSVRFVGLPGGDNFVEPLHVPEEDADGTTWVDPGGLHTDLTPLEGRDAALRRGPAEVLEQTDRSIVLLGPISPENHVRLKKTVQLHQELPQASYTVAVLSESAEPKRLQVRNTVRVPQGATLRIDRDDGAMRPLAGTDTTSPMVVPSAKYWLMPIPPTADTAGVILGAFVPEVTHQNRSGLWIRRIERMPGGPGEVPSGSTFICLLDDATRSYGAALQGAEAEVTASAPAVFTEEWTLVPRGR